MQGAEEPTSFRQAPSFSGESAICVRFYRNDAMAYTLLATSSAPALVVYLLDISASMMLPMGERRRIDVVTDALGAALRQMVFRSTKGSRVAPRYRIAMYAYSDHVYDLLDGIKTVDRVAALGVPELDTMRTTRTAKAFEQAEKLLKAELPNLRNGPAPLVCHMTDGEYNGEDPEPVVERIRQLEVPDGNVLVENIFISDDVLADPVVDPFRWEGVMPATGMRSDYARKLVRMSSPLPEAYRGTLRESGYTLAPGSLMMLPGTSPELVAMGFQMSAATPVH